MQLHPEQLAEAVTCLRRDFRDRLDQERRVLPRFRVWAPMAVRGVVAQATTESYTIWVRDLSRGGIGIMYIRPLQLGEQFVIELPRFDGTSHALVCSVVYCRGAGPDMHSIGARFESDWQEAPLEAAAAQA